MVVPLSESNRKVGIGACLRLAEANAVVVHRLRTLGRRSPPLYGAVVTARRVGLIAGRIRVAACRCRCDRLIRPIFMRQMVPLLVSPVRVVVGSLRILPVRPLSSTWVCAVPCAISASVVALPLVDTTSGGPRGIVVVLRIRSHH